MSPRCSAIVAVLAAVAAAAAATEFYDVDFSELTTGSRDIPDNTDIGTCICDLTLGACDFNCCCDLQCDELEKSFFSTCLEEGPAADETLFCSQLEVVEVNGVPNDRTRFIDDVLCVVEKNDPARGTFYTTPDTFDPNNFNFEVCGTPDTFLDCIDEAAVASGTYEVGTRLETTEGALVLPAAGLSTLCSDSGAAQYGVTSGGACVRQVADLEATCADLGVRSFVEIQVAPAPNSPVGISAGSISITCVDESGSVTPCVVAADDIPDPSYSAASGACEQAVLSVEYRFVGSLGVVGLFQVSATVGPVSADAAGGAQFQQIFESVFSDVPFDTSGDVRELSGNPGYVSGRPILVGFLTTNPDDSSQQAILQAIDSTDIWSLPGASGGAACGSANEVLFGENTLSACTIDVTPSAVANATDCDALRAQTSLLLRGSNDTRTVYVGRYGNADYRDVDDWIAVSEASEAYPSGVGTFCEDVEVERHIQVVFANLGAWQNPQPRIEYVRVLTRTRDIASAGTLELKTTLTFLRELDKEELKVFVPGRPPVLPELPYDVFYPFHLGPVAGGSAAVAPDSLLLLAMALLGAVVVM